MNRLALIPLALVLACGAEDLPDEPLDASVSKDAGADAPDSAAPHDANTTSPADTGERCTAPLVWGECADGSEQCRYADGMVVQRRASSGDDYVLFDTRCDFTLEGSMSFNSRQDLVVRFQGPEGLWLIRIVHYAMLDAAPSGCDVYVDCVLSAKNTVEAYLFVEDGGALKYAHDLGSIPGGAVRMVRDSAGPGAEISLRIQIQLDDYVTGYGRVPLDMHIEGRSD